MSALVGIHLNPPPHLARIAANFWAKLNELIIGFSSNTNNPHYSVENETNKLIIEEMNR